MKTLRLSSLRAASVAALTVGLAPMLPAQGNNAAPPADRQNQGADAGGNAAQASASQPAAPRNDPPAQPSELAQSPAAQVMATAGSDEPNENPILPAPDDVADRTDKKLAGREVRGRDGEKLGALADFLVDRHSGEVAFAIVKSGGFAGIGGKHHLVPFKALQPDGDHAFKVGLNQAEWRELQPLTEEQLDEDTLTISDGERRRLAQQFQRGAGNQQDSGYYTASISSQLVRASELHDEEVNVGYRKIGTIEALVIDSKSGKAQALFDATRDFIGTSSGAGQKFLVPLNKFSFGSDDDDDITSTLARADFQRALPASETASLATPEVVPSPGTPTTPLASAPAARDSMAATGGRAGDVRDAAPSDRTAGTTPVAQTDSGQPPASGAQPSPRIAASSGSTGSNIEEDDHVQGTNRQTGDRARPGDGSDVVASGQNSDQQRTTSSESASDQRMAQSSSQPGVVGSHTPSSTTASPSEAQQLPAPAGPRSPASAPVARDASQPEPELTPTGRTNAEQTPGGDPELASAAQAIRGALDDNSELSRLDVRITPENGKLVLRGTVKDEAQKRSVEEIARKAAGGKSLESELEVQR